MKQVKCIVWMKSRELDTDRYPQVEFFYETPVIIDGEQHWIYTQFWNTDGDRHWESWMDEDLDFSKYYSAYHQAVLEATLAEYGYKL